MTLPTTTLISVEDQNGIPIALSLGTLSGSTAYDQHAVTAIGTINTSRITIGNLKIGTYTVGQKNSCRAGRTSGQYTFRHRCGCGGNLMGR